VYSDNACTDKLADAGTVNVVNGAVPDSNSVTFNNTGTHYWRTPYSGDSNNNEATSICTDEQLVISPLIDLAVTKTLVVTNNGPDTATGVTISDPSPAGNTFVSASTTQGSCTGGAVLHCSLGTIPAGGSVTITLVTTPSAAGTVTNTVTVAGKETETETDIGKGVIKRTLKMKKAGILVFTPIASKRCNTKQVGATNVFTHR
jgi:uncharacterized repeat protein (TIGR01451 family)